MKNQPYVVHTLNVEAIPEEVGYKSDRIDQLDAFFSDLIEKEMLQCASYLMARYGKVFALRSMGPMCAFEDQGDFMPDAIRGIASITKLFTAVSIMQLIERGKLYLDKYVHTILDEFKTTQLF